MTKTAPVYFSLILLVSGVIAACDKKPDHPGVPTPKVSDESAAATTGGVASSRSNHRSPLNLKINDTFSAQEMPVSDFIQKRLVIPSTNISRFQAASSEQRVQVDGKLYTSIDKENYLRFVNGGEISLKLKFK